MKRCIGALAILTFFFQVKAEDLGTALSDTKFDRLVGIWVDEGTQGAKNTSTFAWKFPGKVLEVTTVEPGKTTSSFIASHPTKKTFWVVGLDSAGGSSRGDVAFSDDTAVFQLDYVTGDGQEGTVAVTYKMPDSDRLELHIGEVGKMVFKFVRKK